MTRPALPPWPPAFVLCCLSYSACLHDAIIARGRDASSDVSDDDGGPVETVKIEGDIIANFEAESEASEGEVRCSLRLSRAGQPVTDAAVSLESTAAPITLALRDGQYSGSQTGYATQYAVVVRVDGVELRAPLVGPVLHNIDAPRSNDVVRANTALTVRWSPFGAAEATIEAARFSETPVPDTGSFVIPATAITAMPGRVTEERIRVRRAESFVPSGFADGSRIRVVVVRDGRFSIDGG